MIDLFDRPVALLPAAARRLAAEPRALAGIDEAAPWHEGQRGYDLIEGVAVIEVRGVLYQQLGSLRPWGYGPWGATGYDGIRANLSAALADPAARAIAFLIDSPGGMVAGCFDLADEIFAARGRKRMAAILAENAYSAAYAIASACDEIAVPRTGGTGSIGVVAMQVSINRALDAAGIDPAVITFGEHKADASPFLPLSTEARADMQADVDALGEMFVASVARNRGLAAARVRATQARTYLGSAGVELGLADVVASPAEAFGAFLRTLGA